jgi:hypothetical protein
VFKRCYECPVYVSKAGKPCDSRKVNEEADKLRAELKAEKERHAQRTKELAEKLHAQGGL